VSVEVGQIPSQDCLIEKIGSLTVSAIATLLFVNTLIGCSAKPDSVPAASEHEPLVVFLVRHGEKADVSKDPELSPAGRERAAALATALRSAEIEHVHSSDFIRTRDTAAPIATEYGLEVELYDPRDLTSLVDKLRRIGGRHLVVGHSNTTPQMVESLGGEPSSVIHEESEFDRLYIVTIGRDGEASSVMLRYGEAYDPGQAP
jgi:phosphohistidine phosphatase SixA